MCPQIRWWGLWGTHPCLRVAGGGGTLMLVLALHLPLPLPAHPAQPSGCLTMTSTGACTRRMGG